MMESTHDAATANAPVEEPAIMPDSFGITHTGKHRTRNEDQFVIAELRKSVLIHQSSLRLRDDSALQSSSKARLMAVADGMGGHPGGDVASSLAIDGLLSYVMEMMHWLMAVDKDSDRESDLLASLKNALDFSREQIVKAAEETPEFFGMGTAITVAYLVWPKAYFVHVGDTRAYLIRDGKILQLSTDQTFAAALAEAGAIRREDLESHPYAHVLTSALGCHGVSFKPAIFSTTLEPNDQLLLCSDGLTRHVSDERILQIAATQHDARCVCEVLVKEALEGGGRDNITVAFSAFNRPHAPDFAAVNDANINEQSK